MGLVIAFVFLFALVLFSVLWSLREKHKNQGFIVTSIVLMILDVCCILLLRCDTMRAARNILVTYYVFYGWLFFGALLTMFLTHSKKIYYPLFVPLAIVCVIQSAFTIPNYFSNAFVIITKKIVFGRIYWVLEINWESEF